MPLACLSDPSSYTLDNVAHGPLAEGALRAWAGAQLARAHLKAGALGEATTAVIVVAHICARAEPAHGQVLAITVRDLPGAIRTAIERDLANEVA
jgi:hypothetical protein